MYKAHANGIHKSHDHDHLYLPQCLEFDCDISIIEYQLHSLVLLGILFVPPPTSILLQILCVGYVQRCSLP